MCIDSLEMAVSGTHDYILSLMKKVSPDADGKIILDIGAGKGGLSAKLKAAGFEVSACDLFPDNFRVPGITCLKVDASGRLPYDDNSIDVALAIELIEHIDNHQGFFSEVCRVLKPGGKFLFSTPNILSLKSRVSFLFTGYFYSFGSLKVGEFNPAEQHISAFTLDRYRWLLDRCKLNLMCIETDKWQNSSLLWFFLAPLIKYFAWKKQGNTLSVREQNLGKVLCGRKLILISKK